MDEPLTCQSFPAYLEQRFPDYLAMIWKVRGSSHPVTVTAAILVGEVFVDCIYANGVKGSDKELLARWFETVERALSGQDDVLRKFFKKYVEPIVLKNDRRAGWTQELAGPLLRARLDAAAGASWQHQVCRFGREYEEQVPVEILVTGYLYRNEILLHCLRRDQEGSSLPTTEPFARMPARGGAYAAGVTVAKLLKRLSRTGDDNPRHRGNEFMAFAGITDWLPFYAETLSVSVEGRTDSFALSIWPVHKAGEAGSIDSWPGESLPVSDWRDASELGAAVLAAFRVATINGSSMPQ